MLSDRKLMMIFAEFTAWQNFSAAQLGDAEVEEHAAEAALKMQEAVFAMGRPIAEKVTTIRQAALADGDIQQARERVNRAYAMRKLMAVMHDNCERAVNLISRELSRRIGAGPARGRNASWNP